MLVSSMTIWTIGRPRWGRDAVWINPSAVGADVHLTSPFSAFGGRRWWDYEEVVEGELDLDVDLSGPTFGLLFRF